MERLVRMTPNAYSTGVGSGATTRGTAAYPPASGFLDPIQIPARVQAGRDAVVSDMCSGIKKLRDIFSPKLSLIAVGVGSPGPLELPEGRLRNPPNLPGFDGLELRAAVQQLLASPVIVENDANLAALAECVVGRGKTLAVNSLCMLTLGTGVGSGIVLNGKIWHGMNGMAGETGHNTIYAAGELFFWGTPGSLGD